MICGKKVALRAIQKEDLPQFMEWRNRPDFRKYFREYRELNLEMQNSWFQNTVLNDKTTIMFSIVDLSTEKLLGCCGLCYINWIQRNAELSLYIGYENSYIDQYGYAEDACRLLFAYGFQELNLHKIWAEIYEFDVQKEMLFHKLCMHQDGIMREHHFSDGKWWGSIFWSLLEGEFTIENS